MEKKSKKKKLNKKYAKKPSHTEPLTTKISLKELTVNNCQSLPSKKEAAKKTTTKIINGLNFKSIPLLVSHNNFLST